MPKHATDPAGIAVNPWSCSSPTRGVRHGLVRLTNAQHTLRRFILFCALSLALPASAATADGESDKSAYKFGAFPMIPVRQMHSVFSPIAAEFAKVLEHPVYFRTKPTFAEFRQELRLETYDFAFVQPFDYVLAHDRYHYHPLARFENPLSAIIMVLTDSPLRELKDLRKKKVAFPPVTAAVTQMAKKAFLDAGFDLKKDVELKYTRSHDSCLELVMTKSASACVTAPRAAHIFETKWGKHFRVLYDTPSIPNSLFVVHNRIPKAVRATLLKTITSWPKSSLAGQEFISINSMRLVPATDAEYDAVRKFPVNLDE